MTKTLPIRPEICAGAAGALALTVCAGPTAAADSDKAVAVEAGKHIVLEFAGTIAKLPVVRAGLDAEIGPESYAGDLTFRSAGLAGFFKTSIIAGHGVGRRSAVGLTPVSYAHTEISGKKRRDITLAFGADDVTVTATPRFGSLGSPAPSAQQKREALDPLSMVLQIAIEAGENPCSRVVPVFDSKLRYDLEFQPDGFEKHLRTDGYRGPAVRCRVYYHPLAGYDPEDLAEDDVYATPAYVWLAETAPGLYLPAKVRARYDVGFLPLVVSLELSKAQVREENQSGEAKGGDG